MLFVDNIWIFDTFKPITVERLIVHACGLQGLRFIINVQLSNVAHTYSSYIGSILLSSTNEGPGWLNEIGSWLT